MTELRLAEVLAALSQTADLGMGQPPDTALRTCLLATALCRRLGVSDVEAADIYFTALLQHIGCTAYAHETARFFGGDDIALRGSGAPVDSSNAREALSFLLTGIGKGSPPATRVRAIATALRLGPSFERSLSSANCEAAVSFAGRIGVAPGVRSALAAVYERWDGKGFPRGLAGEDVPLPVRFIQVATQAELFFQIGGRDLATETVRDRAGGWFDPEIAASFVRHGAELLGEIDSVDASVAVLDAEPPPHRRIADPRIDDVARAFAEMADLKVPCLLGHSVEVSRLAERAAVEMGLTVRSVVKVRRAALLQDIGRIGIANGIWDKPGPLTTTEWEQVRLHPYHSERILARSVALAPLAALAGMHHERLDGSGYYRQVGAGSIPMESRLLAAADAYQAMITWRPYRAALHAEAAAAELQVEARQGRLDTQAVRAILEAAGHDVKRARTEWPAGLSDREVEVLRLAVQGLTNREIGETLSISPKTAGHHIQHIYDKIGVSTRAGAAVFSMEHDLVVPHRHEQ